MSKIRTANELSSHLDREMSWRKKELITIKLMHDGGRDHQSVMLRRAGVALLYAHWEGFVKSAGTAFVDYISRQNLRFRDLQPGLLALATKAQLEVAIQTQKGVLLTDLADFFLNRLDQRANLVSSTAVRTKSNLTADRLRHIIALLGLDYRPFELLEKPIIERLVESRHTIAHGQYLEIDRDDFEILHSETLNMLEQFRNQIENAALTKSFLRVGTN